MIRADRFSLGEASRSLIVHALGRWGDHRHLSGDVLRTRPSSAESTCPKATIRSITLVALSTRSARAASTRPTCECARSRRQGRSLAVGLRLSARCGRACRTLAQTRRRPTRRAFLRARRVHFGQRCAVRRRSRCASVVVRDACSGHGLLRVVAADTATARFGVLDHHYIEHTFVLLQVWLGLQWFRQPADLRLPAALGVALGTAPAFHTGLFVLQIAPLASVFVLWLRHREPPRPALAAFAVALVAGMLLVLLPSETFRAGYFEFDLLSWFHLYAAACTAATMLFMAWQRYSSRSLLGLTVSALVMAAPVAGQLAGGNVYLRRRVDIERGARGAESVRAGDAHARTVSDGEPL